MSTELTLLKKVQSFLPKGSLVLDVIQAEAGEPGFPGGYKRFPRVRVIYISGTSGKRQATIIKLGRLENVS